MDKKYRLHIKVYPRSEEEKKLIDEFAYKEGSSTSSWLLGLALKTIKKGRRNKNEQKPTSN